MLNVQSIFIISYFIIVFYRTLLWSDKKVSVSRFSYFHICDLVVIVIVRNRSVCTSNHCFSYSASEVIMRILSQSRDARKIAL